MQTIEEYQHYTRQLEGEVKKWHDAYDASEEVNRQLAKQINPLQRDIVRLNNENKELKEHNARQAVMLKIAKQSHENTVKELQDLLDQFNHHLENETQKEK